MSQRREKVTNPFGNIVARMGATDFLVMRRPGVPTEMALHVLVPGVTRAMNISGNVPLIQEMRAQAPFGRTCQ